MRKSSMGISNGWFFFFFFLLEWYIFLAAHAREEKKCDFERTMTNELDS